MELCQLDKIYHLISENKINEARKIYSEEAIDSVIRLRFKNKLDSTNQKYSLQEVRQHQEIFREKVKKRFGNKCMLNPPAA